MIQTNVSWDISFSEAMILEVSNIVYIMKITSDSYPKFNISVGFLLTETQLRTYSLHISQLNINFTCVISMGSTTGGRVGWGSEPQAHKFSYGQI